MPAFPYVTVAEMRAWLGETDTSRDAALRAAIDAASAMIERWCGRDFATAQRTEQVMGTGTAYLFPTVTPITAVASCTVDGRAIPVRFDIAAVRRTDSARFEMHEPATLTYTAGYDEIPADVILATKLTAQAAYGAGAYDPNLAGESTVGFGSQMYSQAGPGSMPRAAMALLEPLRRRY
jgi:hypothetical protein